jgi:ribosomal protein L11 methyltransferase
MKAFRVRVPDEHEDWASAVLWEQGTEGVEVANAEGEARLLAYFRDDVVSHDLEAALAGVPGAALEAVEVPEVDWVARFRDHFRGFAAGPFWIAPVWDVPDARAAVIVVDPGRAFGTGTHETTRLCLTALAARANQRPLGRLLDVGTGTGILAIAGLRLGARLAVGVDLDPQSTESAWRHAALNRAAVYVVRGDGAAAFRAASFDTVVANISAPLLRERRAELCRLLAPGGVLVLSGLLTTDVPELRASYGAEGALSLLEDGEWSALVVSRDP